MVRTKCLPSSSGQPRDPTLHEAPQLQHTMARHLQKTRQTHRRASYYCTSANIRSRGSGKGGHVGKYVQYASWIGLQTNALVVLPTREPHFGKLSILVLRLKIPAAYNRFRQQLFKLLNQNRSYSPNWLSVATSLLSTRRAASGKRT
jgi:hypothetical protein